MRHAVRATVAGLTSVLVLCHVGRGDASGQTPHQIIPILTEKSRIPLSNLVGTPLTSVVNDAGDFAFLGSRGTALFHRRAGMPNAIRAVQYGDAVPGLPGSSLHTLFVPLLMNASGLVAVRADVMTTNRLTHVILTFDGTTLRTVVTGLDTAPGTGGAKYERAMSLIDLNAGGDVLVGSTLLPLGSTGAALPSLFRIPNGGAAIRVAGPGDASPGTGGTFTGVTGVQMNDSSLVLLSATITGGTGSTGLFAWQGGVLRRIVAQNDANPLGGSFADNFTVGGIARLNNPGLVVFIGAGSLWQNTAGGGTTVAAGVGSATPAPVGGTYTAVNNLAALSHAGDAVFAANISGGASASALFRFRPGSGTEAVARLGEVAPGTGGQTFTAWLAISVNASGTVSFQGTTSTNAGIFQKPAGGALALVVLQSAATPVGGFLFLQGTATQTVASGAVLIRASIANGPDVTYGNFLWSGTVTTLMTNADHLPAGASNVIRPNNFLTAGGDYLGVNVQRAGGRESIAVISPAFQEGLILATEGDEVDGTGGGRLSFGGVTTVMVNAIGDVVIQIGVIGGSSLGLRNAIVAGGFNDNLAPVTIDGATDNGGRVLTSATLNVLGTRPISINSSGTVVFTAVVNGGSRGVFVGTSSSTAQKVAIVGDVTSTGAAITSIVSTHGGINEVGRVLFSASTAAGPGLFSVLPGLTATKVVQFGDAAPGGGTFSGFGTTPMPGFNNVGQVAFVATVTGGSTGGVYLWTPGGSPIVAIAQSGAASPAGGTYAISVARPDVDINDQMDVLFMSDLSGGPGDSGVFIRRGPVGAVELVVRQGQAAPGTAQFFSTFGHGANGLVGERYSLSPSGQVAFFGTFTPPGGTQSIGWWHVEPSGAMQPIVIVPSSAAEFDGGTTTTTSVLANWTSAGLFPVYLPLANGPHGGGLYMYAPITSASTGTGSNVVVTPVDPITGQSAEVTFGTVTGAGATTVVRRNSGPPLPRGWYTTGDAGSDYFSFTTTATYSGTVTVCIDFADAHPNGTEVIRLLQYTNNAWQVLPTSPIVGTEICGTTSSLTVFAVAMALNETLSNVVQNGTFASGSTNWSVFATDGTVPDNNYISWAVNAGVFEYFKVPPPSGSNAAVVLQNTGAAFGAAAPIVARFDLGNTSSVRKRVSVLIHDSNFADLSVCTFWIPPNTPMRSYAMRTHTTIAWTNATISFYAASVGASGGVYQLDNVAMGSGHILTTRRTDCVDPGEPGVVGPSDGAPLLTDGDFTNGLASWTIPFPTITVQVTNGVAEFIRPTNDQPSGVLLQQTGAPIAAGQIVTARFQLGNSSAARKRVTVLLHDVTFGDLSACTFWLPAGQPLSDYSMRTYTTQAWSSATIAFYPATTDALGWFRLDNVALSATPAAPTYGTDCVEPGDFSGLSGDALVFPSLRAAPGRSPGRATAKPAAGGAPVAVERGIEWRPRG